MSFIKLSEISKSYSDNEGINIGHIESYFIGNGIEIDSYDLVITMSSKREIRFHFKNEDDLEIAMKQLELR